MILNHAVLGDGHKPDTANIASRTRGVLLLLVILASAAFNCHAGIGLQLANKPAAALSNRPLSDNHSYRALIIGNNEYHDPDKRWQSLDTAVTDARAVAKLLRENYGFQDVTVLENATRADILHAVSSLSRRVSHNDSVLLYYAGHGYLDMDTKKGYWVPVDARGNDQTTYVRNSTIRDELNTIAHRAKHTLLISDSCFSGSLLRSGTRGPVPDVNQAQYYQQVAEKKSVQIITAGGNEFVDDNYDNSGHSPFTYFLLNELTHNKKPALTASEVSSNVEKAVSNNASQVPESGVLQGAGDELGEFIFLNLRIKVDVQGIPKDKVKVDVKVIQSGEEMPAPTAPRKRVVIPLPTL